MAAGSRVLTLRILWCETYDDGTIGGSHTCMVNVATRLDPQRFQVTAAFFSPNLFFDQYAAAGVPTIVLPGPVDRGREGFGARMRHSLQNRLLLPRAIRRALTTRQIDLVVLNNSVFVSKPFLDACRELGVPVIAYERGLGQEIERPDQGAAVAATAGLGATIAISEAVREDKVRMGFKSRIAVIYDGIDPTLAPGRSEELVRAELELRRRDKVIGMVGNVRHWKGQHVFVDAFSRLAERRPEVHGLIVGAWSDADRDYQAGLATLIRERGLERRLRFLGFRTDVSDLLRIMDVVVHASVKPEPFGMVLLEAMAARRPTVATAMGGPLEILGQGCGELVPGEDAEAMARSVAKYLDDEVYRSAVVERARARVETAFNIRETVARTSQLFAEVAARR